MENSDFCHLHVHTEYSALDGMGTCEQYAAQAAKLGFKYLACTDHGCIDGLISFQKACKKNNITPVLGCELYVVPELSRPQSPKLRGHLQTYVMSPLGFKNLCKLLTFGHTVGFYYKPRVTFEYLLKNSEGLAFSTACLMSAVRAFPEGLKFFEDLYDLVGKNLYCEIMPHDLQKQNETNKMMIELAKVFGLKVIATNDCHYVKRRDYKAQDVLLAIQRKALMSDKERFRFTIKGLYLKTAREMKAALRATGFYRPSYLKNTIELAEKCGGFSIPKKEISLPRVKGVPVNPRKAREFLFELCKKNYEEIFGHKITENKVYKERLDEEFKLITDKKFERYFFIVWELIDWCKQNSILVGPGRGSVGGSLMAYLLKITSVDPIKHNLLFSRFINEDRIDYPDIDIDFEDQKRHLVRQHLETVYGKDNVAGVSSFNRMKARAVLKDVGRAFGVHWRRTEEFTKQVEDNDEHTGIDDAIKQHPSCKYFADKYPDVIRYSKKLEGQVRGYGQHAAALVISKEPIGESGRCNLRSQEGLSIINWEKNDAEYVGLMKLDALGLKLLSILSEAKRLIKNNFAKEIEFEKIKLDDKLVFKEINEGRTIGIFQLGTYAMRALFKELKVSNFNHISDAVALVRPGPANSGMTEEYIKRKNGQAWEPHHPIYERITKDTFGVIVYQEQVMQVISEVAGLPYNVADKVRKIIGKKRDKKDFQEYEELFMQGCKRMKTLSAVEAKEFWEGLQEHAKYSFNRSHSVEYAMLSYWSCWLKLYYPNEFICASLTYGAETKKKELIEEAYKMGLLIMLPKVGQSHATIWQAKAGKLFVPFIEVKGIGKVKAEELSKSATNTGPNIKAFFAPEAKNQIQQVGGKLGEMLKRLGCYEEKNPEITKEIESLFDFRVITNPRIEYKKLYDLFENNLNLKELDPALEGQPKVLKKVVSPIVRAPQFNHKNLLGCKLCSLHKECCGPVEPSSGRFNVAIVGEAPGKQEDEKRMGFIGKSGDKIWQYLKKHGYTREAFFVTNVNKCYPSESKKPNPQQIVTCGSNYLEQELQTIKPIVILAFGNTCLQFFENQKSGIMGKSGSVKWNEKYGAWIVWCLHPAASLYNADNEVYFKNGMKKFVAILKAFSLKNKIAS